METNASQIPLHPMVEELGHGRPIFDPIPARRSYYASRWWANPDGTKELVLHALAKRLYPDADASQEPFWRDRNWENETPENVGIGRPDGDRRENKYGAQAGTPEYWKAYRTANRARIREYQARYTRKRRMQHEEAAAALRSKAPSEAAASASQDFQAAQQALLDDILKAHPDGPTIAELLEAQKSRT